MHPPTWHPDHLFPWMNWQLNCWQKREGLWSYPAVNDAACQQLVNEINLLLGNYGQTIDFSRQLNIRKGIDDQMIRLVDEMQRGGVDALLCYNVNPVYDHPNADAFKKGLI